MQVEMLSTYIWSSTRWGLLMQLRNLFSMTKKEMTERCRSILYGDTEVIGDDFDFMMSILARHSEAQSKIGGGVVRMWSAQNPVYTHTRNFFIERTDGTTTDFSFTQCITKTDDFKSACRNAIRPQIKAFRAEHNMDNSRHVDHHPESFDNLLKRFVEIHGKSKVKDNADNEYGCFLEDPEYEKKWYDFHAAEAQLRDISDKENLTKKRVWK